jgi:hypothetical protein
MDGERTLPSGQGSDHARAERRHGQPSAPRPARASKRKLKVIAGLAAGASFALPLAVMHAVPVPPRSNAVVVPKGAVVVYPHGGAAAPSAPAHTAGPAVGVTRASGVPPP